MELYLTMKRNALYYFTDRAMVTPLTIAHSTVEPGVPPDVGLFIDFMRSSHGTKRHA